MVEFSEHEEDENVWAICWEQIFEAMKEEKNSTESAVAPSVIS